jgi:hypothetical protein
MSPSHTINKNQEEEMKEPNKAISEFNTNLD